VVWFCNHHCAGDFLHHSPNCPAPRTPQIKSPKRDFARQIHEKRNGLHSRHFHDLKRKGYTLDRQSYQNRLHKIKAPEIGAFR
jgi:hypothetical protein